MNQLIEYIDDVEALLQEIRDKEASCCDDAIYDVITDPDGVVQPIEDDTGQDIQWEVGDPPGEATTWQEATEAKCAAAERFANNLSQWVFAVQALHALPTLGILVTLSYFISAMASIGLGVALVGGAFSVTGAFAFMQALRDVFELGPDYELARQELDHPDTIDAVVCAIILADTAAQAESFIDSQLQTVAPEAYSLIRVLPLRWIMGRIFNLDADAGGFGGPCRECAFIDYEPVGLRYEIRPLANNQVYAGNVVHIGDVDNSPFETRTVIGNGADTFDVPWCAVRAPAEVLSAFTCDYEYTNVNATPTVFNFAIRCGTSSPTVPVQSNWEVTVTHAYFSGSWHPVTQLVATGPQEGPGTWTIAGNTLTIDQFHLVNEYTTVFFKVQGL